MKGDKNNVCDKNHEECTYTRIVREGPKEEKVCNLDYPKKKKNKGNR